MPLRKPVAVVVLSAVCATAAATGAARSARSRSGAEGIRRAAATAVIAEGEERKPLHGAGLKTVGRSSLWRQQAVLTREDGRSSETSTKADRQRAARRRWSVAHATRRAARRLRSMISHKAVFWRRSAA